MGLFLLISVLAAIFRVTNLDVIEFKADEAINLFLATRPLFGHPFPPGGTVSSIGLLNPPLLNYLLFPIALFTLDPKMISLFIGFLNSLAVGVFFLIIKRYYGVTTAFVAATLMAFSPWLILFSRKIWPQDLLVVFLIPLIYSLHKLLVEEKKIYWISYVAFSMFVIQLHQASILLITLLTIFLLFKKVKLDWRYIFWGFLIGVIPAVPYLIYITRNLNSPEVFMVTKERFSPQFFTATFIRPFQIMSQGNFYFVMGDDMLTFSQKFPLIFKIRQFFYLEYILLPFGMFLFWKNFPKLRLLVYTTITLPILYFLFHVEPFMHYFLFLIPFLFLFLGASFAFFLRLTNFFLRTASLLTFLALVVISITFNLAFFNLLGKQKSFKGDYGTAFVLTEERAKERLKNYQNDKNYEEMILASYLPSQFLYGHLPVARLIYPYEKTQNEIDLLEKRLKEVPEDARIQKQLIAFYTTTPPTSEVIELLKKKSGQLPAYQTIYEEVSKLYERQN